MMVISISNLGVTLAKMTGIAAHVVVLRRRLRISKPSASGSL